MPERHFVIGRRTNPIKTQRARDFRREMTDQEQLLWQRLRGNGLNGLHFRRQHVIDGFIVDFYCHAVGLVVEVDGSVHENLAEADAERDQALARRGLRILRVRNDQVRHNMAAVLSTIGEAALKNDPTDNDTLAP